MTVKQYIALGISIFVLGAGAYFSELRFLSYSNSIETETTPVAQATSTAIFRIGENSYVVAVSQGETVMDAMRALESSGNLTFTGKDYPGMGFFVESINRKKNYDNMYWILYVNGKPSDVGVSQTVIRSEDVIEWRFEPR